EQGFDRALNNWPWLGAVFYWHFRMVHAENRDQVHYYFGLADSDFNTYPAYDAYREVATQPPIMRYGRRQSSDWTIAYQGDWQEVADARAELDAYHTTPAGPATATFTFRGTGLDLVTVAGPGQAPIRVFIDGRPVGDESISLSQETEAWRRVVPLARGLRDTEHTVRIERAGPGGLAIDALVVHRAPALAAVAPWVGWLLVLAGALPLALGIRRAAH
ncbi:MAG TPA: hypothetical protein VGW38_01820, partial [Chloroflexota bacterium]|nr:hypothetical protein [Chloroflexota bacterium]